MQSRHGSHCSAFLRVDGGSEWSFENELSGLRSNWCGWICTRYLEEEAFKNNRVIES